MTTLDFYFDYRSPYSYLALSQFGRFGAEVRYFPFEIRSLMERIGNVPTSVTCPGKNRYVQVDLRRWATLYGVPLERHPKIAEIDAKRLLRATLAAEQLGALPQAVKAIFNALWGTPAPLSTSAEVAAVLGRAGIDAAVIEPMIDDPSLDDALESATTAAAARGVFGAPTIFVDDEMFFGNDRLDFVQNRLEQAA